MRGLPQQEHCLIGLVVRGAVVCVAAGLVNKTVGLAARRLQSCRNDKGLPRGGPSQNLQGGCLSSWSAFAALRRWNRTGAGVETLLNPFARPDDALLGILFDRFVFGAFAAQDRGQHVVAFVALV